MSGSQPSCGADLEIADHDPLWDSSNRSEPSKADRIAGLDPRTILAIWCFYTLVLASIPPGDLRKTIMLAAIPAFCFAYTGQNVWNFVRRLRIVVPFIVLMFVANVFFSGASGEVHGRPPVLPGIVIGTVLACKAVVSFLALHLLGKSMPLEQLCSGLAGLGMPHPLIAQMLLLHRHGSLVAAEAEIMQRARDLRSRGDDGKRILETSTLLGALFLRSHDRSNRVHRAMLVRGYSGTVPLPVLHRLSKFDFACAAIFSVVVLAVRFYP